MPNVAGTSLILDDEINVKEQSPFGSMVRTRKRTDRGESQISRKASRGEAGMEATFLGSQLMMFGNQQGIYLYDDQMFSVLIDWQYLSITQLGLIQGSGFIIQ